MSYRSFKRLLGETNLERKFRFLFGVCMLFLITGSFWSYGRATERLVDKQNFYKGQLLVDQVILLSHWEQIDLHDSNAEDEDAMFFTKEIGRRLERQEYRSRSIRPPASNRGNHHPAEAPRDEWEWSLIRRWSSPTALEETEPDDLLPEQRIEWAARPSADGSEYLYYQAVRATTSQCVLCHKALDPNEALVEDDLLRVVQVSIPTGPTQVDLNRNRAILLATAIITVFLAMIAAYVIVRYVIVKPLGHLREVSEAISRGKHDMRAEIHTGDEFEQLGVAFNRMLRHLVDAQQELRELNTDLDAKVDQLAQVNLQLFELNRLKSDFLATMSHELRTPLNSIIGFSDILSGSPRLDEKQQRYAQNIQKSGRMLLELINDILDLAKIESGKMEVRLSEFSIEQVVSAQCDMARPLSEKKNIDLDTQIAPGLDEVRQDQAKVTQILNNLLSNAIKFTPEGGRIVVHANRFGRGMLEITVEDTGIGIAEEDRETIFEKFRQGHSVLSGGDAMTREHSGTGLGLSIVKEFCRLLGGEVTLESELGKGSKFTVRLPARLEAAPHQEPSEDASLAELTRPLREDIGPAKNAAQDTTAAASPNSDFPAASSVDQPATR